MYMITTQTQMVLIRQDDEYDEIKLLFWIICHVLSFFSSINSNMYIISTC